MTLAFSGSSPNYATTYSVRDEKCGFQSHGNNSVDHKKSPSLNGNFPVGSDVQETQSPRASSAGAGAARPSFDLKPPPGRAGASPLKPPPGRPELLPPEPPSIKPSADAATAAAATTAAAPPPPPPPAPARRQPPKPTGGPPPPPPPALPGAKKGAGAPPPPPMAGGPGPPRPPPPLGARPGARPLAPKKAKSSGNVEVGGDSEGDNGPGKAKLKPFFWDKVQANNTNRSMVWNQLTAGSFQ